MAPCGRHVVTTVARALGVEAKAGRGRGRGRATTNDASGAPLSLWLSEAVPVRGMGRLYRAAAAAPSR